MEATRQDLARMFGVDARTVSEWQTLGLPYRKTGKSNMYNVPECIRWWAAWKHGVVDEETGQPLDLNKERARLAKEQADKQEMENELRRKELCERSVMVKAWTDQVSACKAHLMGLGGKVAPLVCVETEPAACKAIVDRAVETALTELAEQP